MSKDEARICALFLKPGSGLPMLAPTTGQIRLIAGYGIEGDKNAHSFSPRQVLVTRREESAAFGITPGELRENIVIERLEPHVFVPGAVLHIGSSVSIRLTFHCEPCKRIAHLIHSLREIDGKRGIVGVVLKDGIIRIGDTVRVEVSGFAPMSERPYDRFLQFIKQVPFGKVVTYKKVTIGMGVAESYVRAIPGYIGRTAGLPYPIHRIVDSSGDLITPHVPNQRQLLAIEGVRVLEESDLFQLSKREFVNIDEFEWNEGCLHVRQ